MEIYLVRHTSVEVPPGYAYGQTDVPLRATFEQEATIIRKYLSGHYFDGSWSSPLSRCTRLADYCGYGCAILDNRLKEMDFGEWEMQSWELISSDPRSAAWFNDWIHTPTPSGESFMEQYRRVAGFLDEIRRKSCKKVCLFTHGGVLACAQVYAGICPIEEAFKKTLPYGAILTIHLD